MKMFEPGDKREIPRQEVVHPVADIKFSPREVHLTLWCIRVKTPVVETPISGMT
jgi:hypothetical protein